MHAPIRITPPASLPVSLTDAKLHLRVDHDDEDQLIQGLIEAATDHLDGWTGILGQCLEEQEWRQDFDERLRDVALPINRCVYCYSRPFWRASALQSLRRASAGSR